MNALVMAHFAASLDWRDLPVTVQERAEIALRDTLGCWLAGTRSTAFAAARRAIALDSAGDSTGSDVSAAMRAFAWAIAASAFDHDDGHYEGGGIHPGSTILPTLLATSRGHETREDLLAALVVGYEVAIRAGYLLKPEISGGPYRCTGAASAIGAAAAVASYRGATADTILSAIHIAAAHGPLASLQLPMVKESIGPAAAAAVTAALLAEAGFGGAPAKPSLGIAPSPFDTAQAANPFVSSIGEAWHILATYTKPWPCCRAIHPALAAIETILHEQEGNWGQEWNAGMIERIEVEVMPGLEALAFLPPQSADHAQFSFPFAIGCLLANGAVLPEHLLGIRLTDPAVLAAGARVTLIASPEITPLAPDRSYPAAVTVHAAGRSQRLRIDDAPGSLRNALSTAAIGRKYAANAALAGLDGEEARQLPDKSPAALAAALTPFLVSTDRSTT